MEWKGVFNLQASFPCRRASFSNQAKYPSLISSRCSSTCTSMCQEDIWKSQQKVLCQIGKEYVKLKQGVVRRVQQLFCKDKEGNGTAVANF